MVAQCMTATKKDQRSVQKLFTHWQQSGTFGEFHKELAMVLELDCVDTVVSEPSLLCILVLLILIFVLLLSLLHLIHQDE